MVAGYIEMYRKKAQNHITRYLDMLPRVPNLKNAHLALPSHPDEKNQKWREVNLVALKWHDMINRASDVSQLSCTIWSHLKDLPLRLEIRKKMEEIKAIYGTLVDEKISMSQDINDELWKKLSERVILWMRLLN